jgi:hypothetical protein
MELHVLGRVSEETKGPSNRFIENGVKTKLNP